MRAAFLLGPRHVEVLDVAEPTIGPGEVLVEVTTALTCGTELKAYRQGHRLFKPPMALGHEYVGTIRSVGAGVSLVQPGDRVTSANSAPCDACPQCLAGRTNLCENLASQLLFGAFADLLRVSAPIVRYNLHRVPEGVPDHVAAFVEPFACVVLGVETAAVRDGETVVIVGGTGPIGLMMVQLLRLSGAGRIVAVGRKPYRLALARQFGASDAIDATDRDLDTAVRQSVGSADVVIEITGIPERIEEAITLLRPGGRLILFGSSSPGSRASFDLGRLHYEAIQIRGVFHHTPATVARSLDLLTSGAINVAPLVSARMALDDTAEAMRRFDQGDSLKIAIAPGGRPPAVG